MRAKQAESAYLPVKWVRCAAQYADKRDFLCCCSHPNSPQVKMSNEQIEQLRMVMPDWSMPLSRIDGLRNVLKNPSEGTTTPTGFGGRVGITGLHDEYNHTISFFVYPQWRR